MKIRLCTKAKLYSVREVNDFYLAQDMQVVSISTNVVTQHTFQELCRVFEADCSPLGLHIPRPDIFQLPQQVEYKSHLEMISLVAAPPSHRRSDNFTTHGSILSSISHLSRQRAPVHESEKLTYTMSCDMFSL